MSCDYQRWRCWDHVLRWIETDAPEPVREAIRTFLEEMVEDALDDIVMPNSTRTALGRKRRENGSAYAIEAAYRRGKYAALRRETALTPTEREELGRKTRALLDWLHATGAPADMNPVHGASGLPKLSSQAGFAAVYDRLEHAGVQFEPSVTPTSPPGPSVSAAHGPHAASSRSPARKHGHGVRHELAMAVKVRPDASIAPPQGALPDVEEAPQEDASAEQGYRKVRVFYATDRAKGRCREAIQEYGSRRGEGTLALGVADVAIPDTHEFGEMEGPAWWQIFTNSDPRRHITVMSAGELAEAAFWTNVRACVASSTEKDILVFIHGFNVTFKNGLRRTAQIAKDLAFPGAPILYSWPSHGSVRSYSSDEATIEWTMPHLKQFLRQLLADAGASEVHVIAHSLGNRAAIAAIRELQFPAPADGAARLSQFVLAAPDIDADTFRQLASEFARKPKHCTLYANSEDLALAASRWKHSYPRAGGGGKDVVVVPDVDTIDATGHATDFLSHSYFAGPNPVISDLFYVVRSFVPPDKRARLRRRRRGPLVYWRMAP